MLGAPGVPARAPRMRSAPGCLMLGAAVPERAGHGRRSPMAWRPGSGSTVPTEGPVRSGVTGGGPVGLLVSSRVASGHPGPQAGGGELGGPSAGDLFEDAGPDEVHEGSRASRR